MFYFKYKKKIKKLENINSQLSKQLQKLMHASSDLLCNEQLSGNVTQEDIKKLNDESMDSLVLLIKLL